MSTSTFTGSGFSLQSVTQLSGVTLRLRYTSDPKAVSSGGATDGLNPANYTLTGPAVNYVSSIATVFGDTQSLDLALHAPLIGGVWTLSVANVTTPSSAALTAPTALSFGVAAVSSSPPLDGGAVTDDEEATLRKHLSAALKGRNWDAFIAALAYGDAYVADTARSAFDQLFLSSAGGIYLERKAADLGILKDPTLGLSDEVFSRLAIAISTDKVVIESLLEILEIFYGPEATRANTTAILAEPYALQDSDTLILQIDGESKLTIQFERDDFAQMALATAVEVASVITRRLRFAGVKGFAIAFKDPATGLSYVRIFSPSLGLAGLVRVFGGRAQNVLQFPTKLATTATVGTQWKVEVAKASPFNGIPAGHVRFTWIGGTDPQLYLANIGDYATVSDVAFDVANRNSFDLVDSSPTYFEISSTSGVDQATVTQTDGSGVFFFASTRKTIQSSGRVATAVQGDPNTLDLILPATTEIIERDGTSAAYLHRNTSVVISAASRTAAGLVTSTAASHGLTTGQWVEIDDLFPVLGVAPDTFATADPSHVAPGQLYSQMATLSDGRVLVAGGGGTTGAFLYTPTGSTWALAASMSVGRTGHTLTTLANGTVLAVGVDGASKVCELYTPATNTWTVTGPTAFAHQFHTATLLDNGKVLVVGATPAPAACAELYDPATGLWTTAATPAVVRNKHAAVKVGSRVLVVGGLNGAPVAVATAEIYNPTTNSWVSTGVMGTARYGHTAAYLARGTSGQVLVTGGTSDGTNGFASCEIFDVGTNAWTAAPSMVGNRFYHSATTLGNGNILVTGGSHAAATLATAETYNPLTSVWISEPVLNVARKNHSSILLSNGKVLLEGFNPAEAELFFTPYLSVAAGRLNGIFKVTVLDTNTFTYSTPETLSVTTAGTGGTVTPITAQSFGTQGPFIFDPLDGLAITGTSSLLNSQVVAGQSYKTLTLVSASTFPDTPGYLVFGFGTALETRLVKYLGRISSTQLLLDPNYIFPITLPVGTDVMLLQSRGQFVPDSPESIGSFYLTSSAAGRVAAQANLDAIAASGINLETTIVYPGDRGLGNEGKPAHGALKLSDKVGVWAGDDIDEEVAADRAD